MSNGSYPNILVFSGFDPSGGAGLIADVETANALGGHATGIITCQTLQNNENASACIATDVGLFKKQLKCLGELNQFDAVKIGLVPSVEIADAIADVLLQVSCPTVIDPIIAASGGYSFCDQTVVQFIARRLLPLCDVATPNAQEVVQLAQTKLHPAMALLAQGAKAILVTSEFEEHGYLYHCLYRSNAEPYLCDCERLPGNYHGGGCTLASAIAVYLALKIDLPEAIDVAQAFTYQCLVAAHLEGASIPLRSK